MLFWYNEDVICGAHVVPAAVRKNILDDFKRLCFTDKLRVGFVYLTELAREIFW